MKATEMFIRQLSDEELVDKYNFMVREIESSREMTGPVKEVHRLDDYERMDTELLLKACDDYDYSGETEDAKHYCFWKEI